MYFLGLDIGSSSVKLAIIDGDTGLCIAQNQQPATELSIDAPEPGWAEQSPELWWQAVINGVKELLTLRPEARQRLAAIGISYQMHGLVAIDAKQNVLHPTIMWCDSRASQTGEQALSLLGEDWCMSHLLNSPGNFTLSKLKWLADNRPDIFSAIDKFMLPGDYIAMRLSGDVNTTPGGLSEAILWDYPAQQPAYHALDALQIDRKLLPELVANFGETGELCSAAAEELGLMPGVKLSYRAGDQPNNAFSLNVLETGEIATTAGTSGVIYAVTDQLTSDSKQRINSFLHVNHQSTQTLGLLACINGAGRLNSWLRQILSHAGGQLSFQQLNDLAEQAPVGSLGLAIHPFGNGAERMFGNKLLRAQLLGIDFNRHKLSHIVRAVQEGIAFAMAMGMDVIKSFGVANHVVRAGKANMFLSDVFSQAFVNTTNSHLELYDTNGAEGAARGAAWGSGYYNSRQEAFKQLKKVKTLEPEPALLAIYEEFYGLWREQLVQLPN
jgi:xylulokinase